MLVTATVAIASFWLTPRLPRFRRQHPGVEIRVVVSDPLVDLHSEGIDIALRYGDGDWPDVDAMHLFEVESFPVCSPGYLRTSPAVDSLGDLVSHPLLNLDGALHVMEDWGWWLHGLNGDSGDVPSLDIVGFDNYANVMQAAIDGQGIALGFSRIVDELLDSGRLIRPLDTVRKPGHGVYLVTAKDAVKTETAAYFYAWIIHEAAESSDA